MIIKKTTPLCNREQREFFVSLAKETKHPSGIPGNNAITQRVARVLSVTTGDMLQCPAAYK